MTKNQFRMLFTLGVVGVCVLLLGAVTLINLQTQVMGVLPVANGGLNNSAVPANGQVPIYNTASSQYQPGDPIVSYGFANLANAAAATAGVTSSLVRVSTFGGFGTLYVTYAGITGSPAGCTLQVKNADSLGNLIDNGSTVSTTPANGTTTVAVNSAGGLQTTAQIEVVYTCSTFPTAGTITLDYVPGIGVGVLNVPAVSQNGSWTVTTTPPANATTNVTQFGSNNVVTGTGAGGVGIPRVTISNDSSLAANQSVNLSQIGGTTVTVDPCWANANSFQVISITASTQEITGVAAKQTYICSINLIVSAADNVALVEGTGTTCATSIKGMAGGTTAATGWNLAANGGLAYGTGLGTVMGTSVAADNVCLLVSGTAQVSGAISYVQQ